MNEPDNSQSKSSDELYVASGDEVVNYAPVKIAICTTHTKDNWQTHFEYIDNHDGTVSCKFCPWGCNLPGYMRCHEGRIVDLRELDRS